MSRLSKVYIRNYQSLVDAGIDLGTLTVITGQNDLGKTAILRAIKSAAEATSGLDFITYGKTETSVSLYLDDGVVVNWRKGPKINAYTVTRGGAVSTVYDRIGREVPPDVNDILALAPVEYDNDLKLNINLSEQGDPPFLIPIPGGMSGSQVAKVLGDLTHLNLLYRAVAEADGIRKRSEGKAKIHQDDSSRMEAELQTYDNLPELEVQQETLERALEQATCASARVAHLELLFVRIQRLRTEFDQLKTTLSLPVPDLRPADEAFQTLSRLESLASRLASSRQQWTVVGEQLVTAGDHLTQATKELQEYLESIDTCPTCDQPLPDSETLLAHVH